MSIILSSLNSRFNFLLEEVKGYSNILFFTSIILPSLNAISNFYYFNTSSSTPIALSSLNVISNSLLEVAKDSSNTLFLTPLALN